MRLIINGKDLKNITLILEDTSGPDDEAAIKKGLDIIKKIIELVDVNKVVFHEPQSVPSVPTYYRAIDGIPVRICFMADIVDAFITARFDVIYEEIE